MFTRRSRRPREMKSSIESTLVEQLDQRKVGYFGFLCGNKILKKAETILNKVFQVSATVYTSLTVPAPPPYDNPIKFGHGGGYVSDT